MRGHWKVDLSYTDRIRPNCSLFGGCVWGADAGARAEVGRPSRGSHLHSGPRVVRGAQVWAGGFWVDVGASRLC